jgi:hypothetical protein
MFGSRFVFMEGIGLMVIDNLDGVRVLAVPDETEAILVVDPNRMLPGPGSFKRFQPVARRDPQKVQAGRSVQLPQLPPRHLLHGLRQTVRNFTRVNPRRLRTREVLDHIVTLAPSIMCVKRICASEPVRLTIPGFRRRRFRVTRSRRPVAGRGMGRMPPNLRKSPKKDKISVGDLVYDNGVPKLAIARLVLVAAKFPRPVRMVETQSFIPPGDRAITMSD